MASGNYHVISFKLQLSTLFDAVNFVVFELVKWHTRGKMFCR